MERNTSKSFVSNNSSTASRLTSPTSPRSTRQKLQQKLPNDGKSQIAGPRIGVPVAKGSPSLLTKHNSGSRIPGKGSIPNPSIKQHAPSYESQKTSLVPSSKRPEQQKALSDNKKKPSRIAQTNNPSNLTRLSNKNIDGSLECSSASSSRSSISGYGSQSPLDFSKKTVSPPIIVNSTIPGSETKMTSSLPSAKTRTLPVSGKKYSSETSPICRERRFDSSAEQRKCSSPNMSSNRQSVKNFNSRRKSGEDISNPPKKGLGSSISSIPSTRLKMSSESLLTENPLSESCDSLSSIGSSSKQSSIGSTASDSSDLLPKREHSFSRLPLSSSDQKKNSNLGGPGIPSVSKRPSYKGIPKTKPKQGVGLGKSTATDSRMKLPTATSRGSDVPELSVPSSSNSMATNKFSTLPAKLPSAAKGNISGKSSIRPPGTTCLADDPKKKKFTSPLTHRNKLTYVNDRNDKNTAESKSSISYMASKNDQVKSKGNDDPRPAPIQAEQHDLNDTDQSKLHCEMNSATKLSPGTQRNAKHSTNTGLQVGIQPPTFTSQSIPKSSTAPSKLSSFGFKHAPNNITPQQNIQNTVETTDIGDEKEVETEQLETLKDMEQANVVIATGTSVMDSGEELPTYVPCKDAEESHGEDDGDVVEVSLSRKMDDMHMDDLREIESMNISRSSEMDDGYSSLHNYILSPTSTEEFSKTNIDKDLDTSRDDITMKEDPTDASLMQTEVVNEAKTQPEEITFDDRFHGSAKEVSSYDYADPDDSIQVEMSDYQVSQVDNNESSCGDDGNIGGDGSYKRRGGDLKLNFQHTYSICDYSPVTPSNIDTLLDENDPFTKAFQSLPSMQQSHGSPFKRIHPKVMIPPPHLHSTANNGELAPVPSEYMRTPSSDGDDFMLTKHFSGGLRHRAKKVRTKNGRDDNIGESEAKWMDRDVFYSSKEAEREEIPSMLSTRMSTRSSATSFDIPLSESHCTTDDKERTESTSSDPEKKKRFKLKKFLKKLSKTKKDCKVDFDLESIDDFDNRFGTEACPDISFHRCSLGGESCNDSQDIHPAHSSPTTSFSKRRMFNFKFSSFKKKGKRDRSMTESSSIFTNEVNCVGVDIPSNTVRALCSPELSRRNQQAAVRYSRRNSDSSLFISQVGPVSTSKKNCQGPEHSHLHYSSDIDYLIANDSSSSTFSDHVQYTNWPFSRINVKPPTKHQQRNKGSDHCSVDSCSINSSCAPDDRLPFTSTTTKNNSVNTASIATADMREPFAKQGGEQWERTSNDSHSSDTSLLSLPFPSSSSKGSLPYDTSIAKSTGSLRRTPLRHSVDSFTKLLEVHKQTIEKIATELSSLRCNCEILKNLEWDDFELGEETIQLGLNSYMVVPVTCASKLRDNRRFYAWLRLLQHGIHDLSAYPNVDISTSTLHRNCVHACHVMQRDDATPLQVGIPKAIQISDVFISTQCPKMTLSKYISLTLEKHARYSEIYEREAAVILLQVVKGIQNLYANDLRISCIDSNNVFILNNGEPSVVLSPRKEPNRCPAIAVAALPGLGSYFQETESDSITSICHQLAFLLLQLLHCPYQDELNDAVDMSMLLTTLPGVTIKSIYSRYLQYVVNLLLGTSLHTSKSVEDLQVILETILFGPSDVSEHSEEETLLLINKWHNRRCVDMVTHILKEAPLIMLCASEPTAQDIEKIKNVDQEILLECEFLSRVSAADIYRVSKMLNS